MLIVLCNTDPPWKAGKGLKAPFQRLGQNSAQGKASVQALEKELANFGKEKDKHIRNAQGKAKKAKADTEVMFPCASPDIPACTLLCDLSMHCHTSCCSSAVSGTLLQSATRYSLLTVRMVPVQAAKAALKAAAGALAEAVAERDAAGDERDSIETQLTAALKSVAGGSPNGHQVMTERQSSCLRVSPLNLMQMRQNVSVPCCSDVSWMWQTTLPHAQLHAFSFAKSEALLLSHFTLQATLLKPRCLCRHGESFGGKGR